MQSDGQREKPQNDSFMIIKNYNIKIDIKQILLVLIDNISKE